MLLMNTPFNPVGKVYTKAEMKKIADICIRHNLICLSDEVYEFLVFPPHKHYKIASFPGMWERTITIGSAGKVFGVTGWKIGWTIGPAPFINAMQLIQQNTTYAFCTPLQEALAQTIEEILPDMNTKDCLFRKLSVVLAEKRDRIANALASVGMWPVVPQGGFFMLANISNVEGPKREKDDKRPYDVIFNEWMMKNKGIAGAPLSAFFNDANSSFGDDYLRLCIVKDDSTIERVLECFKKW
uniref:kynurenine--oxoglutarate transaminase n=1 Tax=Mesocestoides corti TaxID=53468 RepID=A0A5K3FYU9_MESCO